MNLVEALKKFQIDNSIPDELIELVESDSALRKEMVSYFQSHQDKQFVIALLDKMILYRQQKDKGITGDNIMLSCYLLGLHNDVRDCLRIWNAKTTDFDTYCGVDIQLVTFAGFHETVNFLEKREDKDAKDCLEYLVVCNKSGDFDNLKEYFAKDKLPWFI